MWFRKLTSTTCFDRRPLLLVCCVILTLITIILPFFIIIISSEFTPSSMKLRVNNIPRGKDLQLQPFSGLRMP